MSLLILSSVLAGFAQQDKPDGRGRSLQVTPRARAIAVVHAGQPLAVDQFREELARLNSFVLAKNLDGLIQAADEIEAKWGNSGGGYYGRLMIHVSSLIGNDFPDEKNYSLSQKYVVQALARADTFPVEVETRLLDFLMRDVASKEQTANGQSAWAKERSLKAVLWLHAWRRIEKGIDRNFDFNDRATLNVRPPPETGAPAGVNPKGIEDTRLRAQYEAAIVANLKKAREYDLQMMLKYLDDYFPKKAEEYLVNVYSQPPRATAELERYLTQYISDQNRRKSILNRVARNLSTQRAGLTCRSFMTRT